MVTCHSFVRSSFPPRLPPWPRGSTTLPTFLHARERARRGRVVASMRCRSDTAPSIIDAAFACFSLRKWRRDGHESGRLSLTLLSLSLLSLSLSPPCLSLSPLLFFFESYRVPDRGHEKLTQNFRTVGTLSAPVAASADFKRVHSKTARLSTPAFSASVVELTTAMLSSGLLSYSDCSACCPRPVTWCLVSCVSARPVEPALNFGFIHWLARPVSHTTLRMNYRCLRLKHGLICVSHSSALTRWSCVVLTPQLDNKTSGLERPSTIPCSPTESLYASLCHLHSLSSHRKILNLFGWTPVHLSV